MSSALASPGSAPNPISAVEEEFINDGYASQEDEPTHSHDESALEASIDSDEPDDEDDEIERWLHAKPSPFIALLDQANDEAWDMMIWPTHSEASACEKETPMKVLCRQHIMDASSKTISSWITNVSALITAGISGCDIQIDNYTGLRPGEYGEHFEGRQVSDTNTVRLSDAAQDVSDAEQGVSTTLRFDIDVVGLQAEGLTTAQKASLWSDQHVLTFGHWSSVKGDNDQVEPAQRPSANIAVLDVDCEDERVNELIEEMDTTTAADKMPGSGDPWMLAPCDARDEYSTKEEREAGLIAGPRYAVGINHATLTAGTESVPVLLSIGVRAVVPEREIKRAIESEWERE